MKKSKVDNMYCPVCKSCGIEGCCDLSRFIDKHIRGKTNCSHESSYIADIEYYYKGWQKEPLYTQQEVDEMMKERREEIVRIVEEEKQELRRYRGYNNKEEIGKLLECVIHLERKLLSNLMTDKK